MTEKPDSLWFYEYAVIFGRHPMTAELMVGTIARACLLTHRFSANLLLARVANPAFEYRHDLRAHHASFFWLGHISALDNLSGQSVENLNLFGMFDYNFQTILRVVFDEADDFHLAVLELFG